MITTKIPAHHASNKESIHITILFPKLLIESVAIIPENKREPQTLNPKTSLTGAKINSINKSHIIKEKTKIQESVNSELKINKVIGPTYSFIFSILSSALVLLIVLLKSIFP